ncbi:MAG: hypothetical protein AB1805_15010 [Nitrospirota bacterium]
METGAGDFGVKAGSALVCAEGAEVNKSTTEAIKGLGYHVETASTAAEALEWLKFNQYEIVVLSETFAGASPEDNAVYRHLKGMPMATRRRLIVALVGPHLKTQDAMTAFVRSVDVVINEKDAPAIKAVLWKAIEDHVHFYKVHKESLEKMGKQ